MMKKLILTILLFVRPISLIDAYPNEPSGYASMYWGKALIRLKHGITHLFYVIIRREQGHCTWLRYQMLMENWECSVG